MSDLGEWEVRHEKWQESPPEEVDHIICDPPFDPRTHANGRTNKGESSYAGSHEKSFESVNPESFVPDLIDRSRRWVICFCSFEYFGKYAEAAGTDRWIRAGLWVKPNPMPQVSGDRPGQPGEGIAIMHPEGKKRWNRGGHPAIWEHRKNTGAVSQKERYHETQKPLALMRELVTDFTDPGDLIWDPYCGSGSTGVAAILEGRNFLGHEIQKEYAELSRDRLSARSRGISLEEQEAGQETLFDLEE